MDDVGRKPGFSAVDIPILLVLLTAGRAWAAEPGRQSGVPPEKPPQFEPLSPGPYPPGAARPLQLRGPQVLLLNARKDDRVSVRIKTRQPHNSKPVGYRFREPSGTEIEGTLKGQEPETLSLRTTAEGTCQLLLDTDSSIARITLDLRPAVLKTPVHLFQSGARLYFRVPRETREFDVFLRTGGSDEHARLDVFDSAGRHHGGARTAAADGDIEMARIRVAVPVAEREKTWYALVRGNGGNYQNAILSFSPDIPSYVSFTAETLMREQDFAREEMAQLYEPFVEELRLRMNETPKDRPGAAYWQPRLAERIRKLEETIPVTRTLDAQTHLRTQLAETHELVTALADARLAFSKCVVWVVKAISDRRIRVHAPFRGGIIGGPLLVAAVPGEYESASFVVRAEDTLSQLKVEIADLRSADGNRIDAADIDVKAVKVWFQDTGSTNPADPRGGHFWSRRSGKKALMPELLLHDDALVRVDTTERKNYLRTGKAGNTRYVRVSGEEPVPGKTMDDFYVADAPTLLPLDVPADTNKQFWVTVHIPGTTKAGIYEGHLTLSGANRLLGRLPFKVRVLPFTFAPPCRVAGIYYYSPDEIYYGDQKMEQFRREAENLHAHSIDDFVMPFNVFEHPEAYEIRRSIIGERNAKTIFYTGYRPRHAKTPEEAKQNARRHIEALRRYGVETVYFYGLDEAEGERLTAQRPVWNAVREVGGRIFVAGYPSEYPGREGKKGNFELMGDIQDLLVCAWEPSLEEARRWHSRNHKIVSYANPQGGIERPDTYRRNFGLLLWQKEYDGLMTYIYHWGASYAQDWGRKPGARRYFPCAWNDDCRKDHYRQHNMVYPTSEGVIDTLQWEGYREAVDDLRYLDTLTSLVEEKSHRSSASVRKEVEATRAFLADLRNRDIADRELGLDVVRADVIDRILALLKAVPHVPPTLPKTMKN